MKPDPRESYLAANPRRGSATLPKAAVDDLKFFAKRAEEGRVMAFTALTKWMLEKHGIAVGRIRLHTLAKAEGITPWWSAR